MKTMIKAPSEVSGPLAWFGFALVATPFYFVGAALLKYGFGAGLFFDPLANFFADPQRLRFLNLVLTLVLFFGGSLLALALNLYAILGQRAKRAAAAEPNTRFRFWNVAVLLSAARFC
jgi:hypothetical protein